MLNYSFFIEIIQSLKHHKLRNILTGFGVAWGIFILILLLGAGQGLQDGMGKLFSSYAQNSIWIYGGQTSITQKNRKAGERINFNIQLVENISKQFYQIKKISPEINFYGNSNVSYNSKTQSGSIRGIGADYFSIKLLKIEKGRHFNEFDFKKQRPVCIIGNNMAKIFEIKSNNLGDFVNISGNWIKIIGVLEDGGMASYGEQDAVYIPLPAFQNSFGANKEFYKIALLLHDNIDGLIFGDILRKFLARKLSFSEEDMGAVYIRNQNEEVKNFNMVFTGVKIFLWFVGISMLLTGIIGVGNIMLVIVKERTKEIGIRKAIGARSKSILLMIVTESIMITTSAGVIGMTLGIIVIKIADITMAKLASSEGYLIDSFSVNMPVIFGALILLIVSGALAGLVPAKKASKVMPVKALNDE